MNEPSPDHNPSDFSTPQGRARENRTPDGWWMIPGLIFGALVWTGIVAAILRWVL
jgi:hypothetical protein